LSLRHSVIARNTATQDGSGMYNRNASPIIFGCTFDSNAAAGHGGAFHNSYTGTQTLINCLFRNNAAEAGGALSARGGSPLVVNATIANNQYNTSSGSGGSVWYVSEGADPLVGNSIIWGNLSPENAIMVSDAASDIGFAQCIVEGSGGSTSWLGTCGGGGGNTHDTDPLFGTFPSNFRLQDGSPAVNS